MMFFRCTAVAFSVGSAQCFSGATGLDYPKSRSGSRAGAGGTELHGGRHGPSGYRRRRGRAHASVYLFSHPDVNDFFTSLKGTPRSENACQASAVHGCQSAGARMLTWKASLAHHDFRSRAPRRQAERRQRLII